MAKRVHSQRKDQKQAQNRTKNGPPKFAQNYTGGSRVTFADPKKKNFANNLF